MAIKLQVHMSILYVGTHKSVRLTILFRETACYGETSRRPRSLADRTSNLARWTSHWLPSRRVVCPYALQLGGDDAGDGGDDRGPSDPICLPDRVAGRPS